MTLNSMNAHFYCLLLYQDHCLFWLLVLLYPRLVKNSLSNDEGVSGEILAIKATLKIRV